MITSCEINSPTGLYWNAIKWLLIENRKVFWGTQRQKQEAKPTHSSWLFFLLSEEYLNSIQSNKFTSLNQMWPSQYEEVCMKNVISFQKAHPILTPHQLHFNFTVVRQDDQVLQQVSVWPITTPSVRLNWCSIRSWKQWQPPCSETLPISVLNKTVLHLHCGPSDACVLWCKYMNLNPTTVKLSNSSALTILLAGLH